MPSTSVINTLFQEALATKQPPVHQDLLGTECHRTDDLITKNSICIQRHMTNNDFIKHKNNRKSSCIHLVKK